MYVYDAVFFEKVGNDGLSNQDILSLIGKFDEGAILYPVDLQAIKHETSAMGFITDKAAERLDYDYESSGFHEYIAGILDDMEKESSNGVYTFGEIKFLLTRI